MDEQREECTRTDDVLKEKPRGRLRRLAVSFVTLPRLEDFKATVLMFVFVTCLLTLYVAYRNSQQISSVANSVNTGHGEIRNDVAVVLRGVHDLQNEDSRRRQELKYVVDEFREAARTLRLSVQQLLPRIQTLEDQIKGGKGR